MGTTTATKSDDRRKSRILVRFLFALATLILLGGCQLAPAGAPEPSSAPARIMPFGDSLTYGIGSDADTDYSGYRGPLQQKLKAAGVLWDFVGLQRQGTAEKMDPDNEGRSGLRIDQLAALTPRVVTQAKPDIVLLLIGANDILQNFELGTAPERLQKLIDEIRLAAPGAKIVVGTLPSFPDQRLQGAVEEFNRDVLRLLGQENAEHGDIVVAPFHEALAPDPQRDISADGIHPNDSGYQKMAEVWWLALQPLLSGTDSTSPHTPSNVPR